MAVACPHTVAAHTSITHDCAFSFSTHTLRFIASTLSPLDLARIMHEEWNADRIVDGAMHDCDECQNLPRVYD